MGKLSDKQDLLPWATYSDIVTETQLLGVVLLGLYSQRVDTLATAIKCTMFVSLRACGPAVHRATGRAIVVALRNLLEHPLSKMHPLVLPAHNPLLAWAVIIIHRLLDLEVSSAGNVPSAAIRLFLPCNTVLVSWLRAEWNLLGHEPLLGRSTAEEY